MQMIKFTISEFALMTSILEAMSGSHLRVDELKKKLQFV